MNFGQTPVQLFKIPHPKRLYKRNVLLDLISHNPSQIHMTEINKENRERELIEKSIERQRRNNEEEKEKIRSEMKPKIDQIKEEIKRTDEKIFQSNSNFDNKKQIYNKEKLELKNKFKEYDQEKTQILINWIKQARANYNLSILQHFSHIKEDIIYIQGLEKMLEKYQINSFQKLNQIEIVKKEAKELECNILSYKKKLLELKAKLRKIPYSCQMKLKKEAIFASSIIRKLKVLNNKSLIERVVDKEYLSNENKNENNKSIENEHEHEHKSFSNNNHSKISLHYKKTLSDNN